MKKILLLLLFFCSMTRANEPNWPTQLFSANQIFQMWLIPFQNYFRDVNRNYVVYNASPNLRVISSSKNPQYNFKIFIQRTVSASSITEVVNYMVKDAPVGRLLIKRTGNGLLPTLNEDLFSFRLPQPNSAEKFQLIFEGVSGVKMNFSNTRDLLFGVLNIYNGEVLVHFNEQTRDLNYRTRSLWYICGECDSTALIANAQKTNTAEWQYVYTTNAGGTITSQEFYNLYSNYYAPPISQYFSKVLKQLVDISNWP